MPIPLIKTFSAKQDNLCTSYLSMMMPLLLFPLPGQPLALSGRNICHDIWLACSVSSVIKYKRWKLGIELDTLHVPMVIGRTGTSLTGFHLQYQNYPARSLGAKWSQRWWKSSAPLLRSHSFPVHLIKTALKTRSATTSSEAIWEH